MEKSILQDVNIQLTSDYLILSPANRKPKYCFIFLHGIDMSVQKFFSVFLSSSIIGLLNDFKIYIPQAPIRPIAMFGGREGHSWGNKEKTSVKNFSIIVLNAEN